MKQQIIRTKIPAYWVRYERNVTMTKSEKERIKKLLGKRRNAKIDVLIAQANLDRKKFELKQIERELSEYSVIVNNYEKMLEEQKKIEEDFWAHPYKKGVNK